MDKQKRSLGHTRSLEIIKVKVQLWCALNKNGSARTNLQTCVYECSVYAGNASLNVPLQVRRYNDSRSMCTKRSILAKFPTTHTYVLYLHTAYIVHCIYLHNVVYIVYLHNTVYIVYTYTTQCILYIPTQCSVYCILTQHSVYCIYLHNAVYIVYLHNTAYIVYIPTQCSIHCSISCVPALSLRLC